MHQGYLDTGCTFFKHSDCAYLTYEVVGMNFESIYHYDSIMTSNLRSRKTITYNSVLKHFKESVFHLIKYLLVIVTIFFWFKVRSSSTPSPFCQIYLLNLNSPTKYFLYFIFTWATAMSIYIIRDIYISIHNAHPVKCTGVLCYDSQSFPSKFIH